MHNPLASSRAHVNAPRCYTLTLQARCTCHRSGLPLGKHQGQMMPYNRACCSIFACSAMQCGCPRSHTHIRTHSSCTQTNVNASAAPSVKFFSSLARAHVYQTHVTMQHGWFAMRPADHLSAHTVYTSGSQHSHGGEHGDARRRNH